ncbi:ester cyclase [Nonomuraea sp. B10E15]|uniref:ester cyclase n=1 Tax=Nonomuraea sp. B10E15 TaxID=3153560 RepID=UPI00325E15E1
MTPKEVVRAHSTAKTSGDVPGCLERCHEDVVFETVAFQSASHGKREAQQQFTAFLGAFPDYAVQMDEFVEIDDLVMAVGTITGTMRGPLAGIEPTGAAFELPYVCLWYVRDELIATERFFYDFNQMWEQLGVPTDDAAARFAAWRDRANATVS